MNFARFAGFLVQQQVFSVQRSTSLIDNKLYNALFFNAVNQAKLLQQHIYTEQQLHEDNTASD